MRITAIADTHMRHDELVLETGDVLIVAGDICDRGTLLEVRDVARWLSEQPFEHVILIGGNHDSPLEDNAEACHRIFEEAGLIYLCDRSVKIGGLEFWGAPYTSMASNWAFGLGSEEALERAWSRIPADVDVLITHTPPLGIGDAGYLRRFGSSSLAAKLPDAAPRLHIFGHVHEDGGAWVSGTTCCVNSTTWKAARAPTHVEIDPETKLVELASVPPKRG